MEILIGHFIGSLWLSHFERVVNTLGGLIGHSRETQVISPLVRSDLFRALSHLQEAASLNKAYLMLSCLIGLSS